MKKMKFKLTAFFYDSNTNEDKTFENEVEINTKHHVDFNERFLTAIADRGILRSLNNQYGNHSIHTDVTNAYFIVEEFAIYTEISEKDFNTLWLKWKSVLKQEGLI